MAGKNNQMVRRVTRPVIGVTGPDKGGTMAWFWTWLALRRAGAKPLRITPMHQWKGEEREGPLHGLVLGGGADIAPAGDEHKASDLAETVRFAKEQSKPEIRPFSRVMQILIYPLLFLLRVIMRRGLRMGDMRIVDEERDDMEQNLLQQALASRLPVLGICRGMQMVNVRLGGTLHREIGIIYGEEATASSLLPTKHAEIAPGSLLSGVVGGTSLRINALHHQAVDKLGRGLSVSAYDEQGMVEALEGTEDDFLLGVQWHPELLPHLRAHQRIFQALVDAAKRTGNPQLRHVRRSKEETGS